MWKCHNDSYNIVQLHKCRANLLRECWIRRTHSVLWTMKEKIFNAERKKISHSVIYLDNVINFVFFLFQHTDNLELLETNNVLHSFHIQTHTECLKSSILFLPVFYNWKNPVRVSVDVFHSIILFTLFPQFIFCCRCCKFVHYLLREERKNL